VKIRQAPSADTDVNALADKVDRQRELYAAYRDLWNTRYASDMQIRLPELVAAQLARLDIDALDRLLPEKGIPTEEEYDELVVTITTAHDKLFADPAFTPRSLDKLLDKAPKEDLGASPPAERVVPEEAGPPAVAALALGGIFPFIGASVAVETVGPFVQRVLERRRAREDEPEGGRHGASAAEPSPAVTAERKRYQRLMSWTYRRDVMWTLVGALVGVIVYVLAIYDATWGSATDYLAAFATGFGSSTIVRWADLPRSGSLRRTEPIPGARADEAPSQEARQAAAT
jgi:hypothetical protein